jgi:RNA polymerase sigma factor (sigma-70 family)
VDTPEDLEALVGRSHEGDRESLERLVDHIQRPVYNVALQMLWHPEDAGDATQEILSRVITHRGSFRGGSRFLTWVFHVAANYLITARHSRVETQAYTFDRFANELHDGLTEVGDDGDWPPDKALLLEEVKVGGMHGRLTCLDRPHRLAYILGEILEIRYPNALLFADDDTARAFPKTLEKVRRLELVRRSAALYRSSPQPVPGPERLESIRAALESP